ncbi:MAG TPA: adenylosuccinate lyase family protein [Ktedonobacteraceae bacterium]|nr:adenylosuccinate lyase family protein [Ktedonobacteraceae bacterium]
MTSHLADSLIYQNSWGTPELRQLFDDVPRTRSWLEILATLAETQADFDLIPREAARAVAVTCRSVELDAVFFEEVRAGFEATNHSTLGLIRALQRRCPGDSGEWLYYGATVQDITDTWTALVLQKVRAVVERELAAIEGNLLQLAARHRDTVMAGRTHGQIGLPITFGFKAATWAAEVQRHRQRLVELGPRLVVGQLAGGVGSLSSLGPRALEVQKEFLSRLGLNPPSIAWTTSRDTLAEWFSLLTLVASTGDRIGHEVYNLQRTEIGEVSEGFVTGTVGSITMPHKRNPEIAEHLGTLARVIRHNTALIFESLVHDHERDGRSWKTEWAVLAETCLATGKLLALLRAMTGNLEIHADRMRANLEATGGFVLSEAVMLALAARIGKQSAHTLVYETAMAAHRSGSSFKEAILANPQIHAHLSTEELETLFDYQRHTGQCAAMVDRVLQELRDNNGPE